MTRFYKNLNARRQLFLCLANVFALTLLSGNALALQVNLSEPVAVQGKPKAQKGARGEQGGKKEAKPAPRKLSEARVTELRGFAKQHHPEIMPLLDFLGKERPKKFDQVMNGLNRDVSNLEKAKQKSPEAYERGLAAWVNQSRIQLYAAQFKVAADKETAAKLRQKIEVLVAEKIDTRIAYLEKEREAVLEKAERIGKSIETQKSTREAMIKKRIASVTKHALKMRERKKSGSDKEESVEKETIEEEAVAKPVPDDSVRNPVN